MTTPILPAPPPTQEDPNLPCVRSLLVRTDLNIARETIQKIEEQMKKLN